ncbi:reverse transcriptase [Plasmopara halstedii]|uniref:Reverse transcriptase n=1 Tax=Plasmopara halstedii TaxID=4781 RepID=A0A0P1AW66_PLAHL|nr:reverse transcriptase [Plasmopara halstedii]CEG45765.1 reverse transcriptase [Plasmopara halstedii]|eukprot:XP_024582134.1 reverse transcriptase [Plasmopara halstedii]
MNERICAHVRDVSNGEILSEYGGAVCQFTETLLVLAVHEYGFVFGLPKNSVSNTGVVFFDDRLSKMAHLAAVPDNINGVSTVTLFVDRASPSDFVGLAIILPTALSCWQSQFCFVMEASNQFPITTGLNAPSSAGRQL